MKKASVLATAATLVVGGALGLGLFNQGHVALASSGNPAPVVAGPANTSAPAESDGPSYRASIQIPNAPDGSEEAGTTKDSAEAAQLAGQARITAEQAKSAALQAVPGQAVKAELDNENGNLVYSVEVKDASGATVDVKVDAGNGQILTKEQGGTDEEMEGTEAKGIEREGRSVADTDAIQLEQEGEH